MHQNNKSLCALLTSQIKSGDLRAAYGLLGQSNLSVHLDPAVRSLAYELFVSAKDSEGLENYIKKVEKLGAKQPEVDRVTQRCFLLAGKYEQAYNQYTRLSAKSKTLDLTMALNHAIVCSSLAKFREARNGLARIATEVLNATRDPRWWMACVELYVGMRDAGKLVSAKRVIRQLLWRHLTNEERSFVNFVSLAPWNGTKWNRPEITLQDLRIASETGPIIPLLVKKTSLFYHSYASDNQRQSFERYCKHLSSETQCRKDKSRHKSSKKKVCIYLSEPRRHVSRWVLSMWSELHLNSVDVDVCTHSREGFNGCEWNNDFNGLNFHDKSVELIKNHLESRQYDLLIYSDVGMDSYTRQLSCMRLAQYQITHWGHPMSTGSPNIDFFISSRLMETPEGNQAYSETLFELPGLGIYLKRSWYEKNLRTSGEKNLIIANSLFKTDYAFMRVLSDLRNELIGKASDLPTLECISTGIEEVDHFYWKRIKNAYPAAKLNRRMEHQNYLNLISRSMINLDTPWSGGNTTLDCISRGVPTVTIRGKNLRNNHTYAINTLMGLDSFCTDTAEEFVGVAVRYLRDDNYRERTRKLIDENFYALFEDRNVLVVYQDFIESLLSKC